MKRNLEILTTAFALSLTALSPALAGDERSQLIAAAGLNPAEAEGLSLQELAVLKYNRDNRRDDAVVLVRRSPRNADAARHASLVAAAGLSPAQAADLTLTELVAYKIDRENTDDLHLPVPADRSAAIVDPNAHWQLITDAGLTVAEAEGLTITELAMIKSSRDTGDF